MEIRTGRRHQHTSVDSWAATIEITCTQTGLELFDRNGNERGFVDPKERERTDPFSKTSG